MTQIGYALSSEEWGPGDLVRNAQRAEEAGFEFLLVSDHFHPWIDRQGQSPFVWSVIGAIAQATDHVPVGAGVTCPTMRIHPAIVAQAAATTAAMLPGRFFLGVGTGENLNEHILGTGWPSADVRLEMLEEAVSLVRRLWKGEQTSFRGRFYRVEDARLYTLPEVPPPIVVAAGKPGAAALAGRIGDGLVSTAPEAELAGAYREAGGRGPPLRPAHRLLRTERGDGEEGGRRGVAERGAARRTRPGAGAAGALRAGRRHSTGTRCSRRSPRNPREGPGRRDERAAPAGGGRG